MATVSIAIFRGSVVKRITAVAEGVAILKESITSSGSSTASSIATTDLAQVVRIATTGDVWVKFDSNPTAAAGEDFLLTSGAIEYFQVPVGYKVAVKDA